EINKAVANNLNKFPQDYCFSLQSSEKEDVVEKFHHLEKLKYSPVMPKAFTEKGLYMLATILKSPLAVEVTFAIIETFAKLRELAGSINILNSEDVPEDETKILQSKVSKLLLDVLKDPLPVKMKKTIVSFNFGVVKISVETTREKSNSQ
ncbi:MAG: ORF6N domain-containing protein, partial [Bacteroidales bacterium]|nr:ORF6N domain-containing protein [Bacteroidales bacterium]